MTEEAGTGTGTGTEGAADSGSGSGTQGTNQGGKTFTQEEVSARAAAEKEQGRRSAEESIAKKLGMTPDEAADALKRLKAQDDKDKSEAQLARESADAEKAAAAEEKASSALEKHLSRVERELVKSLPRDLDDSVIDSRVAKLAKLIDVEVGADADTVKKGVSDLKKEWPELFGASAGTGKGGKPGDPEGAPPKPKPSQDAFARGEERAKALTSSREQYPILQK